MLAIKSITLAAFVSAVAVTASPVNIGDSYVGTSGAAGATTVPIYKTTLFKMCQELKTSTDTTITSACNSYAGAGGIDQLENFGNGIWEGGF